MGWKESKKLFILIFITIVFLEFLVLQFYSINNHIKKEKEITTKLKLKLPEQPVEQPAEEIIKKQEIVKKPKEKKIAETPKKEQQKVQNELKSQQLVQEKAKAKIEAEADAKARAIEQARLKGLRDGYISSLKSSIEKNKKYPQLSKARGEEGDVMLTFRVYRDRRISDLSIKSSSGFEKIDEAALKAVQKLGVFSGIPKDLQEDFLDIAIPMKFKLN